MEWCRMYRLRTVLFVVLLWCELTAGLPDFGQDTPKTLSDRDKKLQELLRTLDSYSTETHQIMPPEQDFSNPSELWTVPPFLKPTESRARLATESNEDTFVPDLGSIKNQQDFYRKMYGTQEGVNFLRKKYGPNGLQAARSKFSGVNRGIDDVKKANEHYLKIRNRARCRTPVPQVVKVKAFYPDLSKDYLPKCAILHRCGDETGCCESDAFHCVPKNIQEVALHFYSFQIGKHGVSPESKVEKLLFQNHTACQCLPINDLPRRLVDGQNNPLEDEKQSPTPKCRECPVPFTSRIYKDGRCGCDCFDRQKPCLRVKRGRDPLSEIERRCVEATHCHIPDCEYGVFDPTTGYCPRRHDEVTRTHQRRPQHSSPNHRWSFLERD